MKAKILTNSKKYRIRVKRGWFWKPVTKFELMGYSLYEWDSYEDARDFIEETYGTSCEIVNETEWRMADANR